MSDGSASAASPPLLSTRDYQKFTTNYILNPLPSHLIAHIRGNAPDYIKELPVKWLTIFARDHYDGALRGGKKGFGAQGGDMASQMRVTEVGILPKTDSVPPLHTSSAGSDPAQPAPVEGRVVVEIEVTADMCDQQGLLAQGALAFLIDECSTLSMVVANYAEDRPSPPGVSCNISVGFHGVARQGTTLRIVNRSLSVGRGLNSGRSDVWCTQQNKIIATGTQTTMPPSQL